MSTSQSRTVVTMVCGGIGLIVFLTIERHGRLDPTAADALLTTLCILASIPLSIIGAGGGVVAFFEKDKHRLFGILGIILNILAFLIIGGVFVLGMIAQARGVPPNL